MILVDVRLPQFDKTIDFQLNEDARGWEIAEEIATMVASGMGIEYKADQNAVMIYSIHNQRQLNLDCTLRQNGVESGDSLLFI